MEGSRRLVVGTGNTGKILEISAYLSPAGITPVPVGDLIPDFAPVEDGDSFLANARIKAAAAVAATGLPSFADDSGLCVVGLGLEPGIRSARYAGPGKSDRQRMEFLLSEMAEFADDARRAYFACALCAYVPLAWLSDQGLRVATPCRWPDLAEVTTEGRLEGRIGTAGRGDGGFGYDPVFFPDGDGDRSLAQYSLTEKNLISHRGRALAHFRSLLQT